jgi:hypothetical protein
MCIKYEASGEKDMHKSGWMVPPRPNVPRGVVLIKQKHRHHLPHMTR